MCCLGPLSIWLCSLRNRLSTESFFQIREGNQTKWISVDEFIREQKIIFNQGVFNENRTDRTIIAITKTGILPIQTNARSADE